MLLSDISGEIVFVKDASNNTTVGNKNVVTNILKEVESLFKSALDISSNDDLDFGSQMKLIKLFTLKNEFSNVKLSSLKTKNKFTTLSLKECAQYLASEYDEKNNTNIGNTTFNDNTVLDWRDDILFDNVTKLYNLDNVVEATSFSPCNKCEEIQREFKKKTAYMVFSIIIHDKYDEDTTTTTIITTSSKTTTTTTTSTSVDENVTGPIQLVFYFRCSDSGVKTMDDYLTPTKHSVQLGPQNITTSDSTSDSFKLNWVAAKVEPNRLIKKRFYQIGVPGSLVTTTTFDPTVLDTIDNIYSGPTVYNTSQPDASGVLLDLSFNHVGTNITNWDISNQIQFNDLSSNTFYAVRSKIAQWLVIY